MTQTSRLNVLIAERNPLVIAAVRDLIGRDERFSFAGSVQSGDAFIEAAAKQPAMFDLAIVGWRLSDMNGGEVLMELKNRQLTPRVIIFSNDHDVGILKQCVRLGAQGFCYQFEDPLILFQTLVAVANGRICIPYTDVTKIGETRLSGLTTRELELLGVLADGWTNLQIASRTGISENTVKYHLKNLYDKLGVRSRAMAVALYASEKRSGS
jgi:DNA-binding NarL/FixJ family response regulator